MHRKATRADFGALIGEVKTLVNQVSQRFLLSASLLIHPLFQILVHNPKSLEDFRIMAQAEGMFVLDQ